MPLSEEKLNKLDRLLSLLDADNSLTKEDFLASFEKVLEVVVKVQKDQADAIQGLERTYQALIERVKGDYQSNYERLNLKDVENKFEGLSSLSKSEIESLKSSVSKLVDEKLRSVDGKMSKVKSGERGEKGLSGRDGSPDAPEAIADKLESLKGDARLNKSAIKGLEEELLKVRQSKIMGRAKVPMIRAIDLTSQVDGSATTFTVDKDVTKVLGLFGSQFPVTFRATTDWTFAGRTISLVTSQVGTPQSGQTLWALCETLFYG